MNQTYLNILYFLYYQKTFFLFNDLYSKKPKTSPILSYLQYNAYKWKAPVYAPLYNQVHVTTPLHANTPIDNYINKYLKNKLQ